MMTLVGDRHRSSVHHVQGFIHTTTGEPIGGAHVEIAPEPGAAFDKETDGHGKFQIDLPSDAKNFRVYVNADGFKARNIEYAATQDLVDIALDPVGLAQSSSVSPTPSTNHYEAHPKGRRPSQSAPPSADPSPQIPRQLETHAQEASAPPVAPRSNQAQANLITPDPTPFQRSLEPDSPQARKELEAEINRLEGVIAFQKPNAPAQERVDFINQNLRQKGYPYHLSLIKKETGAQPCADGGTVIENASATAPPGFPAHTTGILIKGDHPCLTIKNPVAKGLTVGIEVDPSSTPSNSKP